ncbi:MAG TPA: hemolysin family protein [Acidobacteriaceae bacterium]|jgi:CBS domain containing-hemolysin-like protein|nr:hemolysin family protein [Acidobacteriaceae bacterium]
MSIASALLIVALLVVLTFASYIDRLYSEMGKFLALEFQENIDVWEQRVEPRLGMNRDRIALSAAILMHLSLAFLTLIFGMLLFDRHGNASGPNAGEIAQVALGIVLVIVLFNRLLPYAFFTRTRGAWIVRWRGLLLLLLWFILPVTLFLQFLLSIAALAETHPAHPETAQSEAVEALIEAGEEEGILEESDRELVRSAVEFGDKITREVMTPRPAMIAVPATMTLERFLELIRTHPFSRVPVYAESLDHVIGIAFAHDLLQIADADARTRTVASIQREVTFVPETKRVNELLREMQREKQHMSIVIDEYGGVAGLVTIEDLLEELVGAISDEHEQDDTAVVKEPGGAWVVPGDLEIGRVEELLGDVDLPQDVEATTAGGLVSETAGRIPQTGEVVEGFGLRFEIVASTDRRVNRLRISRVPAAE